MKFGAGIFGIITFSFSHVRCQMSGTYQSGREGHPVSSFELWLWEVWHSPDGKTSQG